MVKFGLTHYFINPYSFMLVLCSRRNVFWDDTFRFVHVSILLTTVGVTWGFLFVNAKLKSLYIFISFIQGNWLFIIICMHPIVCPFFL